MLQCRVLSKVGVKGSSLKVQQEGGRQVPAVSSWADGDMKEKGLKELSISVCFVR